jgi:hypothetical protein
MTEARNNDVYGLLAEFETGEDLMSAAERVNDEGYTYVEAYTPFGIKGLDKLVRLPRRHWLRWIVFAGGVVGGLTGFGLQFYSSTINYRLNIGGRPPDSWPAFIPITFELTVLGAAIFGMIGLLWLCGLPMLFHPVFSAPAFKRATSDRFFLLLNADDPKFQQDEAAAMLSKFDPASVTEVYRSE